MTIEAVHLRKDFPSARQSSVTFTAVQPLDLSLDGGELTVITGRSGSGKSTLLNMFAGMLTPTSGTVAIDGTDLYSLPEADLARLRNQRIGLVSQGHTALRALTVVENVLLPSVLYPSDSGNSGGVGGVGVETDASARAVELLDLVGIGDLADVKPTELSGGELRRMAIARALLLAPSIILADEPTAGLDSENVAAVMALLRGAADDGAAVLVVTHEAEADQYADRVLTMDAGAIS